MSYKEMFFIQLFDLSAKNRLVLKATYHVNSSEHAIARAAAYADRGVPGAIAFAQMIDEKADDALEPTLLATFGHIPPEARAA